MLVIPAIDIKEGRCVRLLQGQMSQETVYSEAPEEMARQWFEKGAEKLHLVDLDGAVEGTPVNAEVIGNITKSVPIPLELGGGIRNMETVEAYLNLGVHEVILGTAALKHPDFAKLACQRFPGRIILAIDVRKGFVAVEGWTEQTATTPVDLARDYEKAGIAAIIYTDIQRDGMRTGPNIEATRELAQAVDVPVIASGGISDMEDVRHLLPLAEWGVTGMITGKAIYEGTLDLEEAVKVATANNP